MLVLAKFIINQKEHCGLETAISITRFVLLSIVEVCNNYIEPVFGERVIVVFLCLSLLLGETSIDLTIELG